MDTNTYQQPDARGHFGIYGGSFVSETLTHAIDELRHAWERCRADPEFQREFQHELAHYVHGHNGLAASLRHRGSREALAAKFATMEAKADEITRVWWRDGLSRVNVPIRKEYEPAAVPRRRRRAA